MKKVTNITVRDFSYLFIDNDVVCFCDRGCSDTYHKVNNYVEVIYESECPDCDEGVETIPLGMYKILEIVKTTYGEMQIQDEDNAKILKNDLRLKYQNLLDTDEIFCIFVKNNKQLWRK